MPGQIELCMSFGLLKHISAGTIGQILCTAPSWPLLVYTSYMLSFCTVHHRLEEEAKVCSPEVQRCEFVLFPPLRLLSSTIPWPLQIRFSLTITFPMGPCCWWVWDLAKHLCSSDPLCLGQEAAGCALQRFSGRCMPCCAVPAADTAVKKAPTGDKGLTTSGPHLSEEGTFHLLFLIRKPGTDTVGLLCLPFQFALSSLLCHPQEELSALSQRAVALPCLLIHPSLRLCIPWCYSPVVEAI